MLRNIFTLLKGTVAAQLIGIVALPVLTRLFPPEAFGSYQIFISVLTVLMAGAAFRYDLALFQVNGARELATILRLSFLATVAIALIVLMASLAMHVVGTTWFVEREPIIWLLPMAVVLAGFLQTIGYLPTRVKEFNLSARAKVVQVGSYVGAALLIGFLAPFAGGLVISDLVGRLLSLGVLAVWWQRKMGTLFAPTHWRDLVMAAKRHKEFPLFSMPGSFINAAGGALTPVVIFGFFGIETAGQYGLVERGMMLPAAMVVTAVAQVVTGEVSERIRSKSAGISSAYRRLLVTLLLVGLPPSVMALLFAPQVFVLVFGPDWVLAGQFAQTLAPLLLLTLVAGPLNMVILLCNGQSIQLAWETARLVVFCVTWAAISYFQLPMLTAVRVHVATMCIMYMAYLILADIVTRNFKNKLSDELG
jgi:teichuronic acid exporter